MRDAIQRELKRGGQVYFLHNEVETIENRRKKLEELVPEARIVIAHGQMPERELERVMLDFHKQRFNVLLCSTIIETGIDVPNANTIIIERADKFGLAQLHQLRGRVGRGQWPGVCLLVTTAPPASLAHTRVQAVAAPGALNASRQPSREKTRSPGTKDGSLEAITSPMAGPSIAASRAKGGT